MVPMNAATAALSPSNTRYALSINGKVYGPYTMQQMKVYIAEGRVTTGSLVSCEGGAWRPANEDPALAEAFVTKTAPAPVPSAPAAQRDAAVRKPTNSARDAFLKELEGVRSLQTPAFANPADAARQGPADRRRKPRNVEETAEREEVEVANFVLIFDVKSRGHGKLEEDIMAMGKAVKILPGVWLLHGPYTAGSIRNQLIHHFGTLDSFFIIDASRDKLAWFNFGPEVDSTIRQVWKRA